MKSKDSNGFHHVRAVNKRKTFFGLQRNGGQSCALQGCQSGITLTLEENLAFPDECQSQVCQRSKIATCPDGTT